MNETPAISPIELAATTHTFKSNNDEHGYNTAYSVLPTGKITSHGWVVNKINRQKVGKFRDGENYVKFISTDATKTELIITESGENFNEAMKENPPFYITYRGSISSSQDKLDIARLYTSEYRVINEKSAHELKLTILESVLSRIKNHISTTTSDCLDKINRNEITHETNDHIAANTLYDITTLENILDKITQEANTLSVTEQQLKNQ